MSNRRAEFGNLVRSTRERAGYTKSEHLATAAKISKRMVDAVELGEHAGPKTLRAIARTLGWRETDVLDYVNEKLDELPDPEPPAPVEHGLLAPLDEVLNASVADLAKLAWLYAWYEARRLNRAPSQADEERFMLWALQKRAGQ